MAKNDVQDRQDARSPSRAVDGLVPGLTERHWAVQFRSDADRSGFLRECCRIAGGATVTTGLHHETLFVGVSDQDRLEEVDQLIRSSELTCLVRQLPLDVRPEVHGYGFVFPKRCNRDDFGHRKPMFPMALRNQIITRLQKAVGHPPEITPCHGIWASPDGYLHEDASDLVRFSLLRKSRLQKLFDAVKSAVLSRPQWDQLAWYFGGGGEGYLFDEGVPQPDA